MSDFPVELMSAMPCAMPMDGPKKGAVALLSTECPSNPPSSLPSALPLLLCNRQEVLQKRWA